MPDFLLIRTPDVRNMLIALGYAVVALPVDFRSAIADRILDDIDKVLENPKTSGPDRRLLSVSRRKLLSCIAAAPIEFRLARNDEVAAVGEEDEDVREKRRLAVRLARHKKKYMDEAERNYEFAPKNA